MKLRDIETNFAMKIQKEVSMPAGGFLRDRLSGLQHP